MNITVTNINTCCFNKIGDYLGFGVLCTLVDKLYEVLDFVKVDN